MNLKALNPSLWGFSISLSWTWGLGLFFSVQMAIQFGAGGLLAFAIPNALGLVAFGWYTRRIAADFPSSAEFERHFLRTVGSLRWVFVGYQICALALTFFAVFRYVAIPLGLHPWLLALLMGGATLLLGEKLQIAWLKWSHLAAGAVIVVAIPLIALGAAPDLDPVSATSARHGALLSSTFAGYFVPFVVGLLLGPWLDIQQWQRAIQIRRENADVGAAYTIGGLLFLGILLFHGLLGLALFHQSTLLGTTETLLPVSADGLFHAKDFIIRFLFASGAPVTGLLRGTYLLFLFLCVMSTLDSGYVALKWFQAGMIKDSQGLLVALLPKKLLESALLPFSFAALIGLLTCSMAVELEYFMAVYASFLVGYALIFFFRAVFDTRFLSFSQSSLFAIAVFSLGMFGLGYFEELPVLMMLGSLLPLLHAAVCIGGRDRGALAVVGQAARQPAPAPRPEPAIEAETARPAETCPQEPRAGTVWFEGKWFVHALVTTFQDTNSVGNVYFAQYGLWVGKTRELFFHHVLPSFDLARTPWYVLTRSFEHKFLRESREFERLFVKIRVAKFNRKFVTIEHQIVDANQKVLGKGKQVLLFIDSQHHRIIDIPAECYEAFLPYA